MGRTSKRGFGCLVRELIAWIVPGSPTSPDCLPQAVADLTRGQLDEALRIRREEELPVYQKLGARRDVLVREANIAVVMLRRNGAGDRERAIALLQKAQTEAAQMGLPEAQQIEQVLNQLNQQPSSPSARPPSPAP